MSRIFRRVGTRAAAEISDYKFEAPFAEEPSEHRINADPAQVAMGVLLDRMLSDAGLTIDDAGQDGAVVTLVVPAPEWTRVALDAWTSSVRTGERSQSGHLDIYLSDTRWVAWAAEKPEQSYRNGQATEAFGKAVAAGRHCLGIAAELSELPDDLVHGADLRLTLPLLTSADIDTVAGLLCGDTSADAISDDEATLLTPRLLRLARRPNQDAGSYICKLRDLLKHDTALAVTETKVSPRSAPTLERLHGMDEAVEWGMRLRHDLQAFSRGNLGWSDVDRGCLLSGPPGCGKTLFARALAATCNVPLVSGSYSQWYGSGSAHQGELLKAMRKTFKQAVDCAPSILFLDEVDSFPNRATITHHYADWEIQVVNALLAEVDGVEGREGVVVVAACNHPDKLDPALVRSGRLDRHIRVRLPDQAALAKIMREHLGNDLAGEDLGGASVAAAGLTGADCERIVRGARRRAREAGRTIALADLLGEIDGDDARTPAELWQAAVHEAGHALVSCELLPGTLRAVTLRSEGISGGSTISSVGGGHLSALDVGQRLVFLLAGRAAEEVIIGHPSSGAGGSPTSDLALATHLAVTAAVALGLDEVVGPLWIGDPDASDVERMLTHNPVLTGQVKAALKVAYGHALERVRRRRAEVGALASLLVKRRALDGTEVAAFLARDAADRICTVTP